VIRKYSFRKISILAIALALAALFGLQPVSTKALGGTPTCRQVSPVPVTLSPTDPTTYYVAGQLCAQGSLHGKSMQLLVHGLTYDHQYWDWPRSPQYSYVRAATNTGYATLAIDRIGDGASSHPVDGTQVTTVSGGYVLHQIIQKLRAGAIGGTAFPKVMTVSHSFGAASAGYEAGTYHDVDGVIISGFMHDISPTTLGAFAASVYPAHLDPKFANSGLNDTYLTTQPGARAQFFFNTATTDPGVIATDEQIKQTGTVGELDPTTFDQANAATAQITVPVLIAMGDSDAIFCDTAASLSCTDSNAILARERSHFGARACLEAYVLRSSGHDINLHRNAHDWYAAAANWSDRHVGHDAGHPGEQRCR